MKPNCNCNVKLQSSISLYLTVIKIIFYYKVAESEKYTVEELLADTADCSAKHVQMIVDQSYSGEVIQAVKNSVNHGNVVVFSSGKSNEYSHNSELSLLWTNHNDSRACTTDIFKVSRQRLYTCMNTGTYNKAIFEDPPPFPLLLLLN